jgi:DNA-binding IclR family transcriptional regulator
MLVSDQIEDAVWLLRVEYLETPNLRLTPGETAELLDLDRATALTVLQALEDSAFLELTPEGQFRLAHDRRAANQR